MCKEGSVQIWKASCELKRHEFAQTLDLLVNVGVKFVQIRKVLMTGKGKSTHNRPEDPEGGGVRGIALLFPDLGARRGGWSAPRSGRFTPWKDPVPVV
jgi:hypothetical protein